VLWAERAGRRRAGGPAGGGLRFAFYGRVSTEDWQDPESSRVRQREEAGALVRGHGIIVAEFFDIGESRSVAWGRRPKAAALVAALADPDRGWVAVVVGEDERAFYGAQYALMAPLFEHYGVQLWLPEAGGRVDYASEHDEEAMTVLGLSSKREVTRTSIRVRTAMAAQTREQGRYLGGRPPYGYRLGDAGPHPNKAHAAWGRRAHRLEPDQETAHIARWIFAQRLAGHSVARIARALNEAGIPCPSAADPGRNPHRQVPPLHVLVPQADVGRVASRFPGRAAGRRPGGAASGAARRSSSGHALLCPRSPRRRNIRLRGRGGSEGDTPVDADLGVLRVRRRGVPGSCS
jgi:site-specific DNA recombinase